MKTLIKHYDNIVAIIEKYDLDPDDEEVLIDILDLLIFLILKEVRKLSS